MKDPLQEIQDVVVYTYPKQIQHDFISKVYAILSIQLLFTGISTTALTLIPYTRNAITHNNGFILLAFVLSLGSVCIFTKYKNKYPHNIILLGIITFVQSVSLSYICGLYYDYNLSNLVFSAIIITFMIFTLLSIVVHYTKYDFSACEQYLFVQIEYQIKA